MKGLLTYRTFQFSMSSVPHSRNKKKFSYRRLLTVTMGYRELSFGYRNCTSEEPDQPVPNCLPLALFWLASPFGGTKNPSRRFIILTRLLRALLICSSKIIRSCTGCQKLFSFFFFRRVACQQLPLKYLVESGRQQFYFIFRDLLLTAFETNLAKNVQAQYISPKFAQVFF